MGCSHYFQNNFHASERVAYTEGMLTTKEAAAELGVTDSRIRQLILSGELKADKFGRDWLIYPKSLEAVRHRPGVGRPAKEKVSE